MAEENVVRMESEAARAERFKGEMGEALMPVLALINEAKKHSMLIEFHLHDDQCGRASICSIGVVKRY